MLIGAHETHPAADVFPLLDGEVRVDLVESIRAHGLLEPILRDPDGKILDGRNRLLACYAAKVDPTFDTYYGNDPLGLVLSLNLHRRHMNASQRAMAAARIATLRDGARPPIGGGGAPATKDAAKRLKVGQRTVERARAVIATASAELTAAVEQGRLAVDAAAEVAKLTADQQREVMADVAERTGAGEIRPGLVRSMARQAKNRQLARELDDKPLQPPGAGPFDVLVADPPWLYDQGDKDATKRGQTPYPPMTTEAICALALPRMADDCVLWLWVTNSHLAEGLAVVRDWGFEYRTLLTWAKPKLGLGRWLRGQTEHCIMASRGKPVRTLVAHSTLLTGPVREHSRKPDEFYQLVESLCPGAKVEMFARSVRPGWEAWGAETGKFAS